MKTIKIRTIEEAKNLTLPPIPSELFEQGRLLNRKAQAGGMSRHSILRGIYDLVDKTSAVVEPMTVCSAGCSACCSIPVGVTELEASYIARNANIKMQTVMQSSERHDTTPCPLLTQDRRCSVYQWRPLVCRVYAVFDDPALCAELDTEHVTYNSQSNPIFDESRKWIWHLNGQGVMADIRSFFASVTTSQSQA